MFILIRFLPVIVGVVTTLLFAMQARNPTTYPWEALAGVFVFAVGGFVVAWSRHRHVGDARPLVSSVIAVACMGFGLMLAEGALALWVIPLLCGGTAFLVSELLFLSLYAPARYPVNGLSRVNLVLVPMALWLAAYASLGLTIFIHVSRMLPAALIGALSLAFFWATEHAEASPATRRRWAFIGAWIGVQVGLLVAVLPLDLTASSSFVAFVGAYTLRTRRYGIIPVIPRRQVAAEAATFCALLIAVLATARWV